MFSLLSLDVVVRLSCWLVGLFVDVDVIMLHSVGNRKSSWLAKQAAGPRLVGFIHFISLLVGTSVISSLPWLQKEHKGINPASMMISHLPAALSKPCS